MSGQEHSPPRYAQTAFHPWSRTNFGPRNAESRQHCLCRHTP